MTLWCILIVSLCIWLCKPICPHGGSAALEMYQGWCCCRNWKIDPPQKKTSSSYLFKVPVKCMFKDAEVYWNPILTFTGSSTEVGWIFFF